MIINLQTKINNISKIEVMISSFGGVGTTFLAKHISKYKKTNSLHNNDHLKHYKHPSSFLSENTKVVYIYGNPINATQSLFRRNFHNAQQKAIEKNIFLRRPIPINETIEDYAKIGRDRLHFQKHFNNWLSKNQVYETIFIKHEDIWKDNNIEKINYFLELPASRLDFPKKRERNSTANPLDANTLSSLKKIYAPLIEKASKFESVQLLPKKESQLKKFKRNHSMTEKLLWLLLSIKTKQNNSQDIQ